MAGEGVFPKIGGDIAYASEANKFNLAPRVLFTGSSTANSTSGTNFQSLGSILISGTNPILNDYTTIVIDFHTASISAGSFAPAFLISGTSANLTTPVNLSQFYQNFNEIAGRATFHLGLSALTTDTSQHGDNSGALSNNDWNGILTTSAQSAGSPFVIFWGGFHGRATAQQFNNLSITAYTSGTR